MKALSVGELRELSKKDPDELSDIEIKQVAEYLTTEVRDWDPRTFWHNTNSNPIDNQEEALAAANVLRKRLEAYRNSIAKKAKQAAPKIAQHLDIRDPSLVDQHKKFYEYFLAPLSALDDEESVDFSYIENIVGPLVLGTLFAEFEYVGDYADNYIVKKPDGSYGIVINDEAMPFDEFVGMKLGEMHKKSFIEPLLDSSGVAGIATNGNYKKMSRMVWLLDAIHFRGNAQNRLGLTEEESPLFDKSGQPTRLQYEFIVHKYQSLIAKGIISEDDIPGVDFLLLNEGREGGDISALLAHLRNDERATLVENRDRDGKITDIYYLPTERYDKLKKKYKPKKVSLNDQPHVGTWDSHSILNLSEWKEKLRVEIVAEFDARKPGASILPEILDRYIAERWEEFQEETADELERDARIYDPKCICDFCLTVAEQRNAAFDLREAAIKESAHLVKNGISECAALDLNFFFSRLEQNKNCIAVVSLDQGILGSQQKIVSEAVSLITEYYFNLMVRVASKDSRFNNFTNFKNKEDAAAVISYAMCSLYIAYVDKFMREVNENFDAVRRKFPFGPNSQDRLAADERRAAEQLTVMAQRGQESPNNSIPALVTAMHIRSSPNVDDHPSISLSLI